jgi:DNA-binding IclR family transcriptional regulator
MTTPLKKMSVVATATVRGRPARTAVEQRSDYSKTAGNALVLLNAIARLGPVSLGELATSLKLNRTVVHRLLTTLHRQSFVIKFGSSYLIGPALIRLSASVFPALRAVVLPTMRQLAAQARETVSCAIRDGDCWVVLEQVSDSSNVVHIREEIGARFPLHRGAHGYALLSSLDDKSLADYYQHTSVPDKVKQQVKAVRAQGYAISRSELREGVVGVAVPGLYSPEKLPFALAIILPTAREKLLSNHLAPLMNAVGSISRSIK